MFAYDVYYDDDHYIFNYYAFYYLIMKFFQYQKQNL